MNLLKGTVELLILRALQAEEPLHGYAITEWIQGATGGDLLVEEGTLYPALHRLERKGQVEAEWGLSENNRKAKFYRATRKGLKRLERETAEWVAYSEAVVRALASGSEGR